MSDFDRDWSVALSVEPWLHDRGYDLVESRGPEGMAQGLRRYQGPVAEILVVADRGQWFVDVRPHGAPSGRYDFGVWSLALGSPVKFYSDSWDLATSWQLQPQLEYLASHLSDIESACSPERLPATTFKVREAQEATVAFPGT